MFRGDGLLKRSLFKIIDSFNTKMIDLIKKCGNSDKKVLKHVRMPVIIPLIIITLILSLIKQKNRKM